MLAFKAVSGKEQYCALTSHLTSPRYKEINCILKLVTDSIEDFQRFTHTLPVKFLNTEKQY